MQQNTQCTQCRDSLSLSKVSGSMLVHCTFTTSHLTPPGSQSHWISYITDAAWASSAISITCVVVLCSFPQMKPRYLLENMEYRTCLTLIRGYKMGDLLPPAHSAKLRFTGQKQAKLLI